jgi:hypothetical protein
MAINIQSLFQDIIETPAQRQQRMLQEGILKGRELTSGLTGLARTQAPLVSALMMNMPKRQESLRRGIGGMLGLDVRSESEKVQDALKNVDPNNPQSLLQAAQMIQGLGLGAQAAEIRAMAADVTRQREADLLAKQQASTQMAADLARTEQSTAATEKTRLETEAAQKGLEERNDLRRAMMRQVDASAHLSARQKVDLNLQIQSGGYDNRMGELDDITSNKPIIFGGRAMIQKDGEWKDVELGDTSSAQNARESLILSARLQYEPNSNELLVIENNINNGNIKKASDFKDYAPLPGNGTRLNLPAAVEKQIIDMQTEAGSASVANSRISDAIQLIYDNRLLETGSAGVASSFFELTKNIAGMRDSESFLRTAYTREKNTEIINSLPPGVASDRDVAIFSEGFPPKNASISEILSFFQAAKRINSLTQDLSLLAENHIRQQTETGKFQDATMVGFSAKRRAYGEAMKALRRHQDILDLQLQSNEITQDEAYRSMAEELEGFSVNFGFTPTMYIN